MGSGPLMPEAEQSMDDPYPRNLKAWPARALTLLEDRPLHVHGRAPLSGPHTPGHFADRLYDAETLHASRRSSRLSGAAEPYSLQWFLEIEHQRLGRHGRWIPRLLEFAKHSGETLLGLGNGLGTDWVQYARHGAHVIICTPVAEQLGLVRRNFELRGLAGRFLAAQPACLPLDAASIDVVSISGLLAEVADPHAVVNEVYRVLKPGGKVLIVTPARYDVTYWASLLIPWLRWFQVPPATPLSGGYSARRLRRLFGGFVEHRVYKRQLRRPDVPHLWRWLPLPVLERLIGRFLVLKAFKPLSAAMAVQIAA
jgi:ubiquinone/menaquinone biosynthesis C-methylase UbiE